MYSVLNIYYRQTIIYLVYSSNKWYKWHWTTNYKNKKIDVEWKEVKRGKKNEEQKEQSRIKGWWKGS